MCRCGPLRFAPRHTNNVVKIADFGITKKMDPETKNFSLRGFLRLAVRWLAPECLSGKPILFSESSDMWAFGVFMWEVYKYGVLPFAKLKSAEARDAIKDGAVLPKPQFATEEMYEEIMMKCWCVDPAERWTFASLHTKLNELLDVARAEKPPRDVGAELNAVLNKNLRKMSKKVSMVAKSKKKLAGTSAQFRDRKKSFESTLATMKEGAQPHLTVLWLRSMIARHCLAPTVPFSFASYSLWCRHSQARQTLLRRRITQRHPPWSNGTRSGQNGSCVPPKRARSRFSFSSARWQHKLGGAAERDTLSNQHRPGRPSRFGVACNDGRLSCVL